MVSTELRVTDAGWEKGFGMRGRREARGRVGLGLGSCYTTTPNPNPALLEEEGAHSPRPILVWLSATQDT